MKNTNNNEILFKCDTCYFEELIPIESVFFFDIYDPNDVDSPPCVGCNVCSGTMIPAMRSN